MSAVMVSYRSLDSAWAGRLVDQLRRVLVTDQVQILDSAQLPVSAPPVALGLVVIGPDWMRGITSEDDGVRREVQTLLGGDARVVPVLVGGAPMPRREDLPAALQPLVDLAPVPLSDQHFREDIDQLSLTLQAFGQVVHRREHERRATRRIRGAGIGFIALCLVALVFPGCGVVAVAWALGSRGALRQRGATGMALANLALGLGLFSTAFNVFFLYDQFT